MVSPMSIQGRSFYLVHGLLISLIFTTFTFVAGNVVIGDKTQQGLSLTGLCTLDASLVDASPDGNVYIAANDLTAALRNSESFSVISPRNINITTPIAGLESKARFTLRATGLIIVGAAIASHMDETSDFMLYRYYHRIL